MKRILRQDTLALLIDVQEKLFPHIHEHEILRQNILKLVSGLKILKIPLILTEQYPKGLGPTIPMLAEELNDQDPVQKIAFSCCDEPSFMKQLTGSWKKTVLIAGIESHVCVLQTVIDLISCGFQTVVVEDCVSSRKPDDKKTAIERMRQSGSVITTCESILFELTRYSGTEEFRAVSKLVK